MLRTTHLAAVLLGALACRSAAPEPSAGASSPAASPVAAPVQGQPLASLATVRVLVTPVAALGASGGADPFGWTARAGDPVAFLRTVDAAIATALAARANLPWVYAEGLGRAHRRNASLSSDPYRLTVAALRAAPLQKPPAFTGEPLASQLRGIVALQEDARVALLPVELRFEPAPDVSGSHGRVVLRLAVVDARSTEVRWLGEVRSEAATFSAPALAASIAGRVADLVVAPVSPAAP